FDALRTILPPKKHFFSPQEKLISYNDGGIQDCDSYAKPLILFGVHPCDLAGLSVMDTIFSATPADNHYHARRQVTLVIGLSCMPDKHCFCHSMGTDSPERGYDMFLTELGEYFFVQIRTPQGYKLVDGQSKIMQPVFPEQQSQFKEFWVGRQEAFQIGFKRDNLSAIVDMEWSNPIWEELGKRCLSCGNCTFVCPTCYCFDLVDTPSLSGTSGYRTREWDSCQFSCFAQIAGGYNFRMGPVDRLKFWYRHKLHGFDDPYGLPTCVGCGRCTVSCPAEIDDIVAVVLKLQDSLGVRNNDRH
ncbi:MAG: 4Fe-4S dicluster domain-containing protein, partial [Candidatus Melainabacteria bacterium]|nr:4Fe-4S dicluster domain-containing protein [Candidatus Melainabacteria bacterium]